MVERSNEWGGRRREEEARAKPGNQLVMQLCYKGSEQTRVNYNGGGDFQHG